MACRHRRPAPLIATFDCGDKQQALGEPDPLILIELGAAHRAFAIPPAAGILAGMHLINGVRDPATAFPLDTLTDDADERRQANRAIAVSAVGLALTGLVELAIALVSGSVALLSDALHNLSDVSTSAWCSSGFGHRAAFPPSGTHTATSAPRTSPLLHR